MLRTVPRRTCRGWPWRRCSPPSSWPPTATARPPRRTTARRASTAPPTSPRRYGINTQINNVYGIQPNWIGKTDEFWYAYRTQGHELLARRSRQEDENGPVRPRKARRAARRAEPQARRCRDDALTADPAQRRRQQVLVRLLRDALRVRPEERQARLQGQGAAGPAFPGQGFGRRRADAADEETSRSRRTRRRTRARKTRRREAARRPPCGRRASPRRTARPS